MRMLSKRNKNDKILTKPVFLSSPCEALKFDLFRAFSKSIAFPSSMDPSIGIC